MQRGQQNSKSPVPYKRGGSALAAWLMLLIGMAGLLRGDDPQPRLVAVADAAAELPAEGPDGEVIPPPQRAVMIRLEGAIDGFRQDYLLRRLEMAKDYQADLVILQIDSPGGTLMDSAEIADMLISPEAPRTLAYIPREALSGAAFVSLGCGQIAMHPDARIGDAGPIALTGEGFIHAEEKIISDTAAIVRTLAVKRGRPPALTEAMVRRGLAVYHVENQQTGQTTYMTEEEIESDPKPDDWKKLAPQSILETRGKKFLTVTGNRALELGICDMVVTDREQLKNRLGIAGSIRDLPPETWFDTMITVLNSPWISGLLFLIGLIGLYIEFMMPGIGAGGLVAAICFVIFFWSHWLDGSANLLDVVLFLLGVAFILLELFVLPGFGFAGISGAVLLVVSVVMASQRVLIPETNYDWLELQDTLMSLVFAGGGFVIAAVFLSRHMDPARGFFSRIALAPPTAEEASGPSAEPRPPGSGYHIGDQGVTHTPLRPGGKVLFGSKLIDVVALDGQFLDAGVAVEVAEIHGNRIVVRRGVDVL